MLLAILLPLTLFSASNALDNGLSTKPTMGWNAYNPYACSGTEALTKATAQALISTGLSAVGYNYVNIDAGWQGTARTSSGQLNYDTTRFPSGIASLVSYVHGLGLKFGIYSDAGYYSCDCSGGTSGWQGSFGYEKQDANLFASWGVDYLKYDFCFAVSNTTFVNYDPGFQVQDRYVVMRDAIAATGRPIVYSICEWGVQDPARWASSVGNSWRMSNDIGPPNTWQSIIRIINQVVPITGFAAPHGFNDLDLLEVGNSGMTVDEQKTHFAFWAAAKSPLLISTDVTTASTATLDILKNKNIIALNQDSLGQSIALKRRYANDRDIWAGPLADGSTLVLVINWENSARTVTFPLADVGLSSATLADVWNGTSLGSFTTSYSATVAAHGSLVLKLTNTKAVPAPSFTYYAAASGTLAGGAKTSTVNSTVTVAGYIGNGGTLTLNGVTAKSAGTKLLAVDYINADFTMTNTACQNCRNAYFSVNGGPAVLQQFPISGQSWNIVYSGALISLDGFVAGSTNNITISNPTAYTPDFYCIGVQA